jgi:hypothetical protein
MKTHYHEIPAMVSINEAAKELSELASTRNQTIESEFNGIKIFVNPGATAEKIVESWWDEINSRENAYEYGCAEADELVVKALELRSKARKAVAKDVIV